MEYVYIGLLGDVHELVEPQCDADVNDYVETHCDPDVIERVREEFLLRSTSAFDEYYQYPPRYEEVIDCHPPSYPGNGNDV